uniref:Dispatched RND transporter family member 1 n=1 Tax=Canis lupus familiaris TaxID=9615 RepID=A0A8I3NY44_CANLF
MKGPRNWSMAVSTGNSGSVVLSNSGIATSAPAPGALPPCDGDPATQELTPREAPGAKGSPNGGLQVNGAVKSSFLPVDQPQGAPAMLAQCCRPGPLRPPLVAQSRPHEACPATPAAPGPCCMQPRMECAAALGPGHSPVYQTACCLQPSPPLCPHPPWPGRRPHQPRPCRPFKLPKSYASLIADWPVLVLGMCTLLIVVCALVGVLVPELPDFSDPLLGFEPRGTAIGQRLVTWNNMVKNTGYKATLANYPFKYADEQAKSHRDDRWSDDHYEREKREVDWNFHKDSFFCDVPSDRYSRVVFASAGGDTLWSLPAIKSMCSVDNSRMEDARRSVEPEWWGQGPRRAHSAAAAPAPAHTQPLGKEGATCLACVLRVSSPTAGDALAPGLRAGLGLVLLSTPHTGLLRGGRAPGGQRAGSPAPDATLQREDCVTSLHQAGRVFRTRHLLSAAPAQTQTICKQTKFLDHWPASACCVVSSSAAVSSSPGSWDMLRAMRCGPVARSERRAPCLAAPAPAGSCLRRW